MSACLASNGGKKGKKASFLHKWEAWMDFLKFFKFYHSAKLTLLRESWLWICVYVWQLAAIKFELQNITSNIINSFFLWGKCSLISVCRADTGSSAPVVRTWWCLCRATVRCSLGFFLCCAESIVSLRRRNTTLCSSGSTATSLPLHLQGTAVTFIWGKREREGGRRSSGIAPRLSGMRRVMNPDGTWLLPRLGGVQGAESR